MPNDDEDLELLSQGEVEVLGRLPWSSNATLLCEVSNDERTVRAVYKPRRGERPLWDFPDGLDQREVAAYELSRALGWELIPPTARCDGPHGVGSMQLFIDADFEQHYFTLVEDPRHHDQLRRMCAFDFVANNTDRKSGHCLLDGDGHIWGIDNGLSFHRDFKLRTVIWEFAGEPLPDDVAAGLTSLAEEPLPDRLACLLDPVEVDALRTRARALADAGSFPVDESGRRYPWPLV